jgi:anti-sigma factor RsiW
MADELDKFESQLIAYLDGELSPADALALEQKLSQYPQHRALMAQLRQQRELLRGLPPETAPEALKTQLRGQVNQTGGNGLSHRRLYRIAASVLLMLGAGIVVHQLLPQRGDEAPRFATRMERTTAVTVDLRGTEALAIRADERPESRIDAKKGEAVAGVALAQLQARQQMFASNTGRTIINVATDNPTVLQAEIGRLLRANRIIYSQEAEIPAEAPTAFAGAPSVDGLTRQSADASVDSKKMAAQPAEKDLSRAMAKSGRERDTELGARQIAEQPAAPAGAATPTPNAAPPVAQAPENRSRRRQSPDQQVLVARNVSSGDVAQIENALQTRQVGQKLNYRVTQTSNSQIAGPAPMAGSRSRLNVVAATQPTPLSVATSPVQARGGGGAQTPANTPQIQQPAAQQAEQTMDLLIVVEPESK